MRGHTGKISGAALVYVLVLLSLQIFLLTVGLEALLADDVTLAWRSAAISLALAIGSVLAYGVLHARDRSD